MKWVFSLICLCAFSDFHAQILNQKVELFNEDPFFNEEFVAAHRIRTITASVSFKRDQRPIVETPNQHIYYFNKRGQLVLQRSVLKIRNRIDTTEVCYEYDASQRLIKKIFKDHYGFFAINYSYANDEIIGMSHTREDRLEDGTFKPTSLVWKDSIANSNSESQIRMVHYNHVNKPFKEVIRKIDGRGNILKEVKTNLIGGEREEVVYTRTTTGDLDSWQRKSVNGNKVVSCKKTYGSDGLLMNEENTENNQVISRTRLTYDNNQLLELRLIRNFRQKKMQILQYRYAFY